MLPSVKVGSKTNIPGSKIGGHITAHLPSVQTVVTFVTEQNPIWSKALTFAFDHMELCFVLQAVK